MAQVYSGRLESLINGQQMIYTFDFFATENVTDPNGALLLAQALGFADALGGVNPPDDGNALWNSLAFWYPPAVSFSQVRIKALYDPTQLWERVFPAGANGQRAIGATDNEPTYVAARIQSNRTRSDRKVSTKSLGGVVEADVSNFGVLNAAALTPLNLVASDMNATYTDAFGAGINAINFVVSLEPYDDEGTTKYRLPATEAELIARSMRGVTYAALSTVGTRNSRKTGKGA